MNKMFKNLEADANLETDATTVPNGNYSYSKTFKSSSYVDNNGVKTTKTLKEINKNGKTFKEYSEMNGDRKVVKKYLPNGKVTETTTDLKKLE